jgi:hypothetical protein
MYTVIFYSYNEYEVEDELDRLPTPSIVFDDFGHNPFLCEKLEDAEKHLKMLVEYFPQCIYKIMKLEDVK